MRSALVVIFICMFISALAVISVRHLNRAAFISMQNVLHERDDLNDNWGRLLIEQATWSVLRIEKKAINELSLVRPASDQTRVVFASGRER